MAGILYLKKQSDITSYGTGFDLYCYDIDTNFFEVDFGNPRPKYDKTSIIGNGIRISKGFFFSEREITISKRFVKGTSTTAFNDDRLELLRDWIYQNDDIYLFRNYNTQIQKIKIIPYMSSTEKYSKYVISKDNEFTLLTETPFFEKVTDTTATFTKNTTTYNCTITNAGLRTPFIIDITLVSNISNISIYLFENVKIYFELDIIAGSTITIDMSNMSLYIDDVQRFVFIEGAPFQLESGLNNLYVSCNSNADISVVYTERYI